MIVALFSYFSIEMIAVAAGEAAHPEVAVTRAFRATLIRLILFYLLTLALVLAIVPWPLAGIEESPFVKVMRALHVPGAAAIFNVVILVAALSAMNSQLYIGTRMMFSLSRAGYAPQRFGVLNRRGVPVQALLLSSIGIAVATALSVAAPKSAFILMVAISSFGTMFTWLMIFATHYRFRRVRARAGAPPPRFRHARLSGDDAPWCSAHGRGAGDHRVHRRLPHDPRVRGAVPGRALRDLLDLVSPRSAGVSCLAPVPWAKEPAMTTSPIPQGYRSVTPYLIVKGAAEAIDFYKRAFGATEMLRMADPQGRVGHAELQDRRLGDHARGRASVDGLSQSALARRLERQHSAVPGGCRHGVRAGAQGRCASRSAR